MVSRKGIVTVLEVTDTLRTLARNDLNEGIFAAPAITNDKLYIRTTLCLYAFGR